MDPTLSTLTLGSRVWVICERQKLAQAGEIITVGPDHYTVKLPSSSLPPQRYDRQTGMRIFGCGPQRVNDFFIRTELPPRYLIVPEYKVIAKEASYAQA